MKIIIWNCKKLFRGAITMRLEGFDYTLPYFYMVTLSCEKGFRKLSQICGDSRKRYFEPNEITFCLLDVIRSFHNKWPIVEPISCFSIMPDHIHLLIKLRKDKSNIGLTRVVWLLKRELEEAYFKATVGAAASKTLNLSENASENIIGFKSLAPVRSDGLHLFKDAWHDWIVKSKSQLSAFTKYIRENPERSFLRSSHREYFQKVKQIDFLNHKWFAYGNFDLVNFPVLEPFYCSRSWIFGGEEWRKSLTRASRIGPGGVGVSTFMSPCEKACGRAIGKAGGRWIVLYPEGFGPRWHPNRIYEKFCAEGRMLFLSLYHETTIRPMRKELYNRCHKMIQIVDDGLD